MHKPVSVRVPLLLLALVSLLAMLALACDSEPPSTGPGITTAPPPTSTPADSDVEPTDLPSATATAGRATEQPAATSQPTTEAEATRTPPPTEPFIPTPLNADDLDHLPDDPTDLMFALLESSLRSSLPEVGRKMAYSHNQAFIPVLMELMRFQRDQENVLLVASYLVRIRDEIPRDNITIVPPGQELWGYWQEWLAQNPEVRGPEEFDRWKGVLFSLIDPAIGAFMYSGVPTTIRLEEVVWGGVRRDGISDLRFPTAIAPERATYLELEDRVFGVSINGEHRAYPLRVLNAHEMANDILGGVQFALAY